MMKLNSAALVNKLYISIIPVFSVQGGDRPLGWRAKGGWSAPCLQGGHSLGTSSSPQVGEVLLSSGAEATIEL